MDEEFWQETGEKPFLGTVWGYIKDIVQVIVFALILTFILRTFVVEARQIPSGSMLPTLQVGDRLLVDKIVYRLKGYERFDIIVFSPPPGAQVGEVKNDLIKRVIAIPGDTIQVIGGKVLLNGEPLMEAYIENAPAYSYGPVTIPEEAVFVMGDNRNNSFDSHAWGFLPIENIKGRAFFRFWPLDRIGVLEGHDEKTT